MHLIYMNPKTHSPLPHNAPAEYDASNLHESKDALPPPPKGDDPKSYQVTASSSTFGSPNYLYSTLSHRQMRLIMIQCLRIK